MAFQAVRLLTKAAPAQPVGRSGGWSGDDVVVVRLRMRMEKGTSNQEPGMLAPENLSGRRFVSQWPVASRFPSDERRTLVVGGYVL